MTHHLPSTRRDFLRRAIGVAGALALPVIIPARALGREGAPAPSNRITIGMIGLGGMGTFSLKALAPRTDCEIIALCDLDAGHLADAKKTLGDLYAEAGRARELATYADYRELLARPEIDAVVISTPDHWHVLIAIAAARAGKDIYCEKPLTLTVAQGPPLCAAVARYGRVLQVGSWQRSRGGFRRAVEMVRQGRLGTIEKIEVGLAVPGAVGYQAPGTPPPGLNYDMWLGPAPWQPYSPGRVHGNFRWFYDYSGGMVTDWGAHHLDIAQWVLGCERSGPVAVRGTGEFPTSGLSNTPIGYDFCLSYDCAHGKVDVVCNSTFENGLKITGSEGTLFVSRERIASTPERLLAAPLRPTLGEGGDHYSNWLDCIRTRQEPNAPVEIAHRSSTACHLANIAMLTGRALTWDPKTERFVTAAGGDEPANRMLARAMRSPWHLA